MRSSSTTGLGDSAGGVSGLYTSSTTGSGLGDSGGVGTSCNVWRLALVSPSGLSWAEIWNREILKLKSGLKVIKLVSWSTQLSMEFILLINVKMPTIVDILTFISRINTTSEYFKQENVLFFSILLSMSIWNFMLSWDEHEKSLINSGPGLRELGGGILISKLRFFWAPKT